MAVKSRHPWGTSEVTDLWLEERREVDCTSAAQRIQGAWSKAISGAPSIKKVSFAAPSGEEKEKRNPSRAAEEGRGQEAPLHCRRRLKRSH